MARYYECHITCGHDDPTNTKEAKEIIEFAGWKFSKIDGDPELGEGARFYATNGYPESMELVEVVGRMALAAICMAEEGLTIHRQKVELICYDTRAL